MNYTEVTFSIKPFEPWADLLAAELGELGFESFIEEDGALKAYVPEEDFDEEKIEKTDVLNRKEVNVEYSRRTIPRENWNETWESNFRPVVIDDELLVRATFHKSDSRYPAEIIIDPKMSFGTGHHATTHLVLSAMRNINFKNKKVLDMGAGTGVLGIYASMKGAQSIKAIEIEAWAADNIAENAQLNGVSNIEVVQGGEEEIGHEKFDVILANINKNVLLDQMNKYGAILAKQGILLISGFYTNDVDDLKKKAEKAGLNWKNKEVLNDWTLLRFEN